MTETSWEWMGGGDKIKLDPEASASVSNTKVKYASAVARSLGSLLSSM